MSYLTNYELRFVKREHPYEGYDLELFDLIRDRSLGVMCSLKIENIVKACEYAEKCKIDHTRFHNQITRIKDELDRLNHLIGG